MAAPSIAPKLGHGRVPNRGRQRPQWGVCGRRSVVGQERSQGRSRDICNATIRQVPLRQW